MQISIHIKKIIAFLLLLLFIEKAGLRLWIHTHYHTSSIATLAKTSEDKNIHKSVSETGCDCMDDFFIPLSFTDTITVALLIPSYFNFSYSYYKNSVALSNDYAVQLRGPPSC